MVSATKTFNNVLVDGKPVESDYTFTAEDSSMEVQIAFTFNASSLAGKDLVTFEELYDLSNPDEPTKVAEEVNTFMELKHVIPNMEKTFGNLEFAGENKVEQRRINGRMTVVSRSFNLYSDVQRADDIIVVLPASAGEKNFESEEKVKLINPKITAEGYKIGTRGFTNYILSADDMVKA